MVPVSPIKPVTRLDRINPQDLYYAIDTQDHPLRYLHLSGTKLTTDRNYAWYGTKRQFRNLCREHEWDALSLINRPK
ncbi:hypothetical protein HL13_gp46 [Dinoroseobacter phage DFL12phi1]|uniref:Uncharacterized protein n=2 Tax=Baltimorevirus DFL12 TaxID=2169868 RepID=A0A023NGD8_9CAUD|nr:hypothetical protein HL13_gp46 [Dinoroseobacter phage DFL12phi1]AHX01007.1 hypothetical protein DFL12P1_0046 [Dinoroseobacter phage DFL12phi1]AID16852.1 hypothetical protein vBDshPR2C_37 [Dinoroseobacter phage vBDshPR2C]